ncbi:hypothetical protein [Sphingobium yanoikuyae]|uniref:hypothetical protein n=1 Tax=Sphingobium yanoikuyae TaxID=13690 RepID=UPI0028965C96|nr:hypothetical protein [Sphingobium yanoikuyae]
MKEDRGYRYGMALFCLMLAISGVTVIYGSHCCAAFPPEDQAIREHFGAPEWRGIKWLTAALMDWPMGFRLCLMTLTASLIGLAVAFSGFLLVRHEGIVHVRFSAAVRAFLAAILVGVIYILTIYAAGFYGYQGSLILVSWLEISLLVSLMNVPNRSGVILAVPLTVAGFGSAAIISMLMDIPWD